MTETKQTTRFALCFFLYYLGASVAVAMMPALYSLSDGAFMCIAQLVCILPPICIYFFATKKPIRETLRLHPLGWKNALLVILLAFAVQPIMSLLSFVSGLFFPNPVEDSAGGMLSSGFWLSLLSMAILPPILEEISNRGILLSGYRYLGKWQAALLSALLFAFLHMNPQQFLYTFAVGFLFGVLVERTDSLFASILPHCVINATTVFALFSDPTAATAALPEEVSLSMVLASALLMALLSLPALGFLFYLFLRQNPPKAEPLLLAEDGTPYREKWLTPAFIGILAIYFVFGLLPYFLPG